MTLRFRRSTALLALGAIFLTSCVSFSLTRPLDHHPSPEREATECRKIMADIAQAEETYKAQSPERAYTSDLLDLQALSRFPICPSGGQYRVSISAGRESDCDDEGRIVPRGGLIVRCAHKAHGVHAPEAADR